MYKNIVLAYDGSLASQEALINCKDLSQWQQSHVHLLAVAPYDLVSMGPETTYYNEEDNKIEHDRFVQVLLRSTMVTTAPLWFAPITVSHSQ